MALTAMKLEENSMDEHDRLLVLERDVMHIDKTLSEVKADMKSGFQRLETKIDDRSGALDKKIDDGFERVNGRIDKNLFWTLGMFGGGVIALATFMYFLFSRIPVPAAESKAGSTVSAPAPAEGSQPHSRIESSSGLR